MLRSVNETALTPSTHCGQMFGSDSPKYALRSGSAL
jgi:hypothetical protein